MAKLGKKQEVKLARVFFNVVYHLIDNYLDDVVYEDVDPECKYPDLCDRLNFDTVGEIFALGFKAKYGEEWEDNKDA